MRAVYVLTVVQDCRNLRWHHGWLHATLGLSIPTPIPQSPEFRLLQDHKVETHIPLVKTLKAWLYRHITSIQGHRF